MRADRNVIPLGRNPNNLPAVIPQRDHAVRAAMITLIADISMAAATVAVILLIVTLTVVPS